MVVLLSNSVASLGWVPLVFMVPEFSWFESVTGADPDRRNYRVSNLKIESAGYAAATPVIDGVRELVRAFPMIARAAHGNA